MRVSLCTMCTFLVVFNFMVNNRNVLKWRWWNMNSMKTAKLQRKNMTHLINIVNQFYYFVRFHGSGFYSMCWCRSLSKSARAAQSLDFFDKQLITEIVTSSLSNNNTDTLKYLKRFCVTQLNRAFYLHGSNNMLFKVQKWSSISTRYHTIKYALELINLCSFFRLV